MANVKVKNVAVDFQAGTNNGTAFATWELGATNTGYTKEYKVKWQYYTKDGIWFPGTESTTSSKRSTYSVPSNALKIRVNIKPVAKTYTIKVKETTGTGKKKKTKWVDKTVSRYTSDWSGWSSKAVPGRANPKPATPTNLNVTINGQQLTVTADVEHIVSEAGIKVTVGQVEFEVVKNRKTVAYRGYAKVNKNRATFTRDVALLGDDDGYYSVRARSHSGYFAEGSGGTTFVYQYGELSDWSDYSNEVGTAPKSPANFTLCKALTESSVQLAWTGIKSAESYTIEYTTKKTYFDSGSNTQNVSGIINTSTEITGLDPGNEYFFRVKAVNKNGESEWSQIASTIIGKKPSPPTTWTLRSNVMVGEPATIYWVHNSEDGSNAKVSYIRHNLNGTEQDFTVNHESDKEEDTTKSYTFNTSALTAGREFYFMVKTKGAYPEYSDWSISRTIKVFAATTLELNITDSSGVAIGDTITSFPIVVNAEATPLTQNPVMYHLTIVANEDYETSDETGEDVFISAGTEVYSGHFNASGHTFSTTLNPSDVNLDNGISYTFKMTVSMDSGLNAEAEKTIYVSWVDEEYVLSAEFMYNEGDYSISLKPYCVDDDGNLIEDMTISVYRREFDGTFTEIAKDINNSLETWIPDPHPALDYARYRLVGVSNKTGGVDYTDLPAQPMNVSSIIIQWDEQWRPYDVYEDNVSADESPLTSSLLNLPYNIDVSNDYDVDVNLINYIGREHPVSYYGTQNGESAVWNTEIPKDDEETLYGLRCLATWKGDCYVREPSGTGYWANVKVSYSQKHRELTIPITLTITRVEGGA